MKVIAEISRSTFLVEVTSMELGNFTGSYGNSMVPKIGDVIEVNQVYADARQLARAGDELTASAAGIHRTLNALERFKKAISPIADAVGAKLKKD